MSVEELAAQFLNGGVISCAMEERLRIPADRLAIYRLIVDREPRLFHPLLLRLFDEEIAFRKALWHGTARDDGDFFEGIYHCAFLIHCCGDPSDTMSLWKAQHLNQDIGELDGTYFVGAGVDETLSYLYLVNDPVSIAIVEHIEKWLSYLSSESLTDWRQGRRQWIRDVSDGAA